MKLLILVALATAAVSSSADFTCTKPVNPIPAGTPGVCCDELDQGHLLTFLYTGKGCTRSTQLSEAPDGSQTYESCGADQLPACCDPLVFDLTPDFNPACILPE